MQRGRIFYTVSDDNHPSGGEKHSYQHVDVLNESGFEAYALHTNKGTHNTWFENRTRVIDMDSFWDLYNMERDYIVIPETLAANASSLPGKKVIFNKNLYHGYVSFGRTKPPSYSYTDSKVVAAFAVSDHNLRHLQFAFPGAKIFRMYAHIDCGLFAFRSLGDKQRRIAFSVKSRVPLHVLCHTLMARNATGLNNLQDYELTFLEGFSEQQMVRVLQDSLILIFLGTYEGLPRTVLEAMACGCLVVGYGTGPLKECLPAAYQFEPDDFLSIAQRIESIMRAFPSEIDSLAPLTEKGREIAEAFTLERQKASLISAWNEIMAR